MDPRAQSEERGGFGDNAMKAGTYGIRNLKRIVPMLPVWMNEKGEDYKKLDKIYEEAVTQFSRYMA